ncbi:hypothetical protein ACLB1E_34870 [Escherichia coli]
MDDAGMLSKNSLLRAFKEMWDEVIEMPDVKLVTEQGTAFV